MTTGVGASRRFRRSFAVIVGAAEGIDGVCPGEEDASDASRDRKNAAETAESRVAAGRAAMAEALVGKGPSAFEETEVDRAKAQVLRFLNYKPRTRAELMTKLIEDKLYDPEVAAQAMDDLQAKGVHSDVDYAEQWGRYKWRTAKWAPWRIRAALTQKGINARDATEGLERIFDTMGEVVVGGTDLHSAEHVQEGSHPPTAPEAAVVAGEEEDKGAELLRAARRRWALSRGLKTDTRHRRLVSWLERRGHRIGLARKIVGMLEAEDAARVEEEEEWDGEDDAEN